MTDRPNILVSGGASCISSHAVLAFRSADYHVAILDELFIGRRAHVPAGVPLIAGDVGAPKLLRETTREQDIAPVVQFALADPERCSRQSTRNAPT